MSRTCPSVASAFAIFVLVVLTVPGTLSLTPNDPEYWRQWAYPKIETPRAWDIELGSSSVVVAILDTGADLDHVDLMSRLWTNPGEVPGNGLDDDGNGFVDDVNGWDFVNNDNSPDDDNTFQGEFGLHSHGTHVMGIASAQTGNGWGVAGTAQVSIMVLKVADNSGLVRKPAVVSALDYAINNGARIVSMSFGWPGLCVDGLDGHIRTKLTQTWNAGLLLLASTGNTNADDIYCPANHPNVIPVGATTEEDLRWVASQNRGSNYGTHLSLNGLVAPGKDIYSTMIYELSPYGYGTGTSMSTPFVSGVAGLILSRNPTLTNSQVKSILLWSADDLGATGPDIYFGYGRLNALRAVLGAEDRPYVKMTMPLGGEDYAPGSVSVRGYVHKSAFTPTRVVQSVLVDISNKACGVFPNWREAPFLEWSPEEWAIQYFTDTFPDCYYFVSAKAWDGVNWSNLWTVQIRIVSGPPPPR